MRFTSWTDAEIQRWLLLRAVEWNVLPAFASQPLVPILFLFLPWYLVVAAVVLLNFLWSKVRYSYVNATAANAICLFVVYAKWPFTIGSAIYLIIHRQYVAGLIALLWPLLAGLVPSFLGEIGTIELAFAMEIGYPPAIRNAMHNLTHQSVTPPASHTMASATAVTPAPAQVQVSAPTNHQEPYTAPSLTDYIFYDIPYIAAGAEFSLGLIQSLNLSSWRGGVPVFTDSEKSAMQRNLDNFLRAAHDMANEQKQGEILFHPDAVEPLQRLFGGEALKELADSAWKLTGKPPKYWTPYASTYLKAWTITFDPLVLLALSELLALAGLKADAKKAAEIVAGLFPSYAPHYYGSSGIEGMRKSFATSRVGSDVTGHVAALARETLQTL